MGVGRGPPWKGGYSLAWGFNPPSYTHLCQWWSLAPLGAKACSQGREPLGAETKSIREPRRGDGNLHRSRRAPVAPPGLSGIRCPPFQGLTPLATCLGSYGAKLKEHDLCIRGWVS